ncbi:hypothetical protein B0J11DRAFT_258913 [Dendryphion nanum]|uniref:Uncharacterized protein n=1 Tax=Dendryphion nanum TaxID=256645 RepID=A0A9P9ISD8_9PLEO|nr:hypothetical protein B0J11DRAFT_258913 [Dendryphion nanum]
MFFFPLSLLLHRLLRVDHGRSTLDQLLELVPSLLSAELLDHRKHRDDGISSLKCVLHLQAALYLGTFEQEWAEKVFFAKMLQDPVFFFFSFFLLLLFTHSLVVIFHPSSASFHPDPRCQILQSEKGKAKIPRSFRPGVTFSADSPPKTKREWI